MIRAKIDDLIREKEYREKRRLSLKTIAGETGLAIGTVQKLRRGDVSRVYLSTLDTLCGYFGAGTIGDVLEYVPGAPGAEGEGR
jgi:putative transcriptional regulator